MKTTFLGQDSCSVPSPVMVELGKVFSQNCFCAHIKQLLNSAFTIDYIDFTIKKDISLLTREFTSLRTQVFTLFNIANVIFVSHQRKYDNGLPSKQSCNADHWELPVYSCKLILIKICERKHTTPSKLIWPPTSYVKFHISHTSVGRCQCIPSILSMGFDEVFKCVWRTQSVVSPMREYRCDMLACGPMSDYNIVVTQYLYQKLGLKIIFF